MVLAALLVTGASVTASVLVVQVAVLPLVFKYSKTVQRKIVFSNFINCPRNLNYDSPSSSNIVGGRNLQIEFQSQSDNCPIKLGVWHILPASIPLGSVKDSDDLDTQIYQQLRTTNKNVVLYCHGNSNHRASSHRLTIYKLFQELDFHVITFDYRGYGDSTQIRPTERGVVEDLFHVYAWVMKSLHPKDRPMILLWGHSLGTAVASNMVAHLPELCKEYSLPDLPHPDGLVLEAPFNNLTEEIECHPFSKFVSWLPYFKDTFVKPFGSSTEYAFTTDQYLPKVPQLPILMLHSKGDRVVPYELSVKLHEAVVNSRKEGGGPVVFHSFDKGKGLGHNNLCEASEMHTILKEFLDLVKKNIKKSEEIIETSKSKLIINLSRANSNTVKNY